MIASCRVFRATRRALALVAVALVAPACGDDDRSRPDADAGEPDVGTGDAGNLAIEPPMDPAEPAAVRFDCPAGWVPFETPGGAVRCDAWAGGTPPECAEGEVAFPGESCTPIGGPCPADGWPADLPDSGVVYVRSGATGGAGTRERPYATVARGLAAARGGRIVAVAPGVYRENLDLSSTTVIGACTSETIIEPADPSAAPVGIAPGEQGAMRDVQIRSPVAPLVLLDGARVSLEDVVLDGDEVGALVQDGAVLTGSRVVVREPSDTGVILWGDARLELARAVIVRPGSHGIAAVRRPGATVVLEDVAILSPGEVAVVGSFTTDVHLAARRTFVSGAWSSAIVMEEGTTELEDVVIHGTRAFVQDDMALGVGLLTNGGSATLRRVAIVEAETGGIAVLGTTLDADGLIVDGVAGVGTGTQAISSEEGAHVVLRGVHVERAAVRAAIAVLGAAIEVHDATLIDLSAPEEERGGAGFFAVEGATAVIERMRVERFDGVAVGAGDVGTTLRASDLTLADPRATGRSGYGIQATDDCDVGVSRARITGARSIGALVDSATASLEDVTLSGIASGEGDGDFGIGLLVDATGDAVTPAHVTLSRAYVEGAHRHGVLVYGAAATLELRDVAVAATDPAPCGATTCEGEAGGSGVVCAAGASLDAQRLLVERSSFAGLLLVEECGVSIVRGRVRDNVFGLVSDTELPTGALSDVVFERNEVDFQTTVIRVEPPDVERVGL